MATRVLSFGGYARACRENAGLSIRAVNKALGGKPVVSQLALIEKGGYGSPRDPEIIRRWAKVIGADPVRMLVLSGVPIDQWKEAERRAALKPELLDVLGPYLNTYFPDVILAG